MLMFELKYHFKQLSFQLACLLFLALGMFTIAKGNFASEEVFKNSAYVSAYIISFLSLFSIFSSMLFCASVVLRDYTYKMDSVIFTTAVTRFPYFMVRFLGLLIAVFIHLSCAALGIFIGTIFVDGSQLGDFNFWYYLHPLLVFGFPNVLLAVSCIFCTALLTKNVRAIYAAGVLLYIVYMVASILGNSPLFATSTLKVNEPSILPYLFDPFGMTSFFTETKKWTNELKNIQFFSLKGVFLANRLIWLSFSAALIFISYKLFNFRLTTTKPSKQKKAVDNKIELVPFKHFEVFPVGLKYNFLAFNSQFKLELISLFKHIPFMVMLLLWVFVFGVELKDTLFNGAYGIHAYPTTGLIIEEMQSMNFALVLIIFYAAELVGREKTTKIDALIYSTPVKGGVLWGAKCLTISVLVMVLVTLNIGIGIGVQVANGYFNFELINYLSLYYYSAVPLILFVILIVFVQNLTANKYLGMLLSMLVVFVFVFGSQIGLSHFMIRYAAVPHLQFSYFNGFGHYAKAFNWYILYWGGLATLIAVLTVGMWQKSIQYSFWNRLQSIPKTLVSAKSVLFIGILVWLGSGAFIYYNTNIVGVYSTKQAKLDWQINYEKKYAPFVHLPQPVIKSITTDVDLFNEDGYYLVKGIYHLKNETNKSIVKIWVGLDRSVNTFSISMPDGRNEKVDKEFNQQFIELKQPLAPGAETTMSFSLKIDRNGFVSFDTENAVVSNGTYIELEKFVPHFGYDENIALEERSVREKAGLPEKLPGYEVNYKYQLIDFESTISTTMDQQVVTVGELKKEWTANNRRYFKYKTEKPISFMFALSSAKYSLKREMYNGVTLSIYYKDEQTYNLNMMISAIKDAIDYCTANFGEYPLKQFALAEIPHYRGAATAYPGLVFSAERLNFLSNYEDSTKINQAYAITAHEVAHQWWANKLNPAYVAGRAMLTESLAKYTEAVVLEKRFGKVYMSNYLKLDNHIYFVNRNPSEKEQPLAKAIDQGFVYYQKGGITMYAVKEAIGEKGFNNLLKRLIVNHENPNQKATTDDFIQLLAKEVKPNQKKFIGDSFNQVVNYAMNIQMVDCKPIGKGQFKVDFEVKVELNKDGVNKPEAPDMDVDIAFFDKLPYEWNTNTKPLYLNKYRLNKINTRLSILTNKKPKAIAIDPYAYILDANLEDNVVEVK